MIRDEFGRMRAASRLEGYVYFAAPMTGVVAVKIGWSTDPWTAVREGGNRWTWFGLELLATVYCGDTALRGTRRQSLEKRLHRALAASHHAREWFSPTVDVLEALRMATEGADAGAMAAWTELLERRVA